MDYRVVFDQYQNGKFGQYTISFHEIVTDEPQGLLMGLGYESEANTNFKNWVLIINGVLMNRAWIDTIE
jgi:hypothetical protein